MNEFSELPGFEELKKRIVEAKALAEMNKADEEERERQAEILDREKKAKK